MAIMWADGFDHYGTSPNGGRDNLLAGAWSEIDDSTAGTFQISDAFVRTGTHALYADSGSGTGSAFIRRLLNSTLTSFGVAFGVYLLQIPGSDTGVGMGFRDNTNAEIFSLTYMSDGSIALRDGDNNGTIIAQSDPVMTAQTWNHIEVKMVIDPVVGEIEVRVNGEPIIEATDLDLGSTGVAGITFNRFVSNPANTSAFYIDDVVTWDITGAIANDFIGPCRVETLFPSADTAVDDWSVTGAADGYQAIDEVPPDGDTSYISADTAAMVSEFELDNLLPETDTVIGVYAVTMAKLDSAGSGNLQTSLVSGGDVAAGDDNALTTAYTYRGDVFMTDPDTTDQWTKAAVNAMLLRVEKTL